jgi:hypothetical protein
VSKVCQAYKDAGLPEPTFENYMSGTLVTIPRDPGIYGDYSDSRGNVRGKVEGNVTGNEAGNVTGNVTGNVKRIVLVIGNDTFTRDEIMQRLGLKGSGNFRATYLYPAIEQGYVAKLYPESDKRPDQAYYLTEKGKDLLQIIPQTS